MKRILLAIVILAGALISGSKVLQYNDTVQLVKTSTAQLEETNAQIQQYQQKLSEMPMSKYTTNSQLISDVLNTDTLKLIQITAQAKDEAGNYTNIVSVNSIEEAAYFTNTISRIVIIVSYDNFKKAYEYVGNMPVMYSKVSFDMINKTASIYLTPIMVGESDISNEITDQPDAEIENTQSVEEQNVNQDIQNISQDDTQFDIQYLGGDSE